MVDWHTSVPVGEGFGAGRKHRTNRPAVRRVACRLERFRVPSTARADGPSRVPPNGETMGVHYDNRAGSMLVAAADNLPEDHIFQAGMSVEAQDQHRGTLSHADQRRSRASVEAQRLNLRFDVHFGKCRADLVVQHAHRGPGEGVGDECEIGQGFQLPNSARCARVCRTGPLGVTPSAGRPGSAWTRRYPPRSAGLLFRSWLDALLAVWWVPTGFRSSSWPTLGGGPPESVGP